MIRIMLVSIIEALD
jgi:hypothetical protein